MTKRRDVPWRLVLPLVIIFGTAALGNALFPALVTDHPLLLLALNATTRHLVATSTSVDVVPYVAVALTRRLVEDPFLYLLGRRYGDAAVDELARRLGGERLLAGARRHFRVLGAPLVFLFPGGVVCVLAGASGMPLAVFLVLNVVGTLVTIALLRSAGESVSGSLAEGLELVGEHVLPLTLVSIVVTAAVVTRRWRRSGSELDAARRLEEGRED